MPGVILREGVRGRTIRYSAMVKGRRFAKMCDLPAGLMVDARGRATHDLRADYNQWLEACRYEAGALEGLGRRVPTVDELLRLYYKTAWARHQDPNWRRPSERTIENVVRNARAVAKAAGVGGEEPCTRLLRTDAIQRAFDALRGTVRGITAWNYISSLQSLTATWARRAYAAKGWEVKPPVMPDVGRAKAAPEYRQLDAAQRERILAWYRSLKDEADPRLYLAASLTLQLGMRPNDAGRLTAENFVRDEATGCMRLRYTPHKTAETSNRRVDWPIPDELWAEIAARAGARATGALAAPHPAQGQGGLRLEGPILTQWATVYGKLNRSMRKACGMEGWTKAVYEMRKLCIDTVYHRLGPEYAVMISGDRRETIERYYSDPYRAEGLKPTMLF